MKVVVTDVSVLFDLFEVKVLQEFFALKWEIYTTDFVYNEIIQTDQKEAFETFRGNHRLKILSFTTDEVRAVQNFKTNLSIRSIADKTILWKALQMQSILLTCDDKLRREAEVHSIEVHGSIWVIEQLVVNGIAKKAEGICLLEELKTTNSRLPIDIIDNLIRNWKK